jgi:hypothetical protein
MVHWNKRLKQKRHTCSINDKKLAEFLNCQAGIMGNIAFKIMILGMQQEGDRPSLGHPRPITHPISLF